MGEECLPRALGLYSLPYNGVLCCVVSTPYSYSCNVVPPDGEDLLEAAHGVAAAMRLVHGTPMRVHIRCVLTTSC